MKLEDKINRLTARRMLYVDTSIKKLLEIVSKLLSTVEEGIHVNTGRMSGRASQECSDESSNSLITSVKGGLTEMLPSRDRDQWSNSTIPFR